MTHGYSPFRSLYGFDPRTIHVSEDLSASPAAEEWLDRMTAVHKDIHNTLKHINDKRSGLSLDKARSYNPGDKVLVDRRNLTIKSENNRTLTSKYIGPFTVKRKVGSHAYEVETPDRIRLHKVIHTSLLKLFQERPKDQMDINEDKTDELFFVVEKIINSCRVRGQVQYRVY